MKNPKMNFIFIAEVRRGLKWNAFSNNVLKAILLQMGIGIYSRARPITTSLLVKFITLASNETKRSLFRLSKVLLQCYYRLFTKEW